MLNMAPSDLFIKFNIPRHVEKNLFQHIVIVVTKKPPMCQIMRLSLYCMNGSIESRYIN